MAAFTLGNFSVADILYGVAEDFKGNILYTLDQLTNASIEVSSDSTDVTDKSGNVVRTLYNNKTGSFTATSALITPSLLAASSGNDMQIASESQKIVMPKIVVVEAGKEISVADAKADTIHVIGIYNNGANSPALTKTTSSASFEDGVGTFKVSSSNMLSVPAAGDGNLPVKYLVKYDREVSTGGRIVNTADKFPNAIRLTLYCAVVDPCDDNLRAAYVYCPNFMVDPSVTINLSRDNQEIDFNGNLNIDYCGSEKRLYEILFPDESAVVTGTVVGGADTPSTQAVNAGGFDAGFGLA